MKILRGGGWHGVGVRNPVIPDQGINPDFFNNAVIFVGSRDPNNVLANGKKDKYNPDHPHVKTTYALAAGIAQRQPERPVLTGLESGLQETVIRAVADNKGQVFGFQPHGMRKPPPYQAYEQRRKLIANSGALITRDAKLDKDGNWNDNIGPSIASMKAKHEWMQEFGKHVLAAFVNPATKGTLQALEKAHKAGIPVGIIHGETMCQQQDLSGIGEILTSFAMIRDFAQIPTLNQHQVQTPKGSEGTPTETPKQEGTAWPQDIPGVIPPGESHPRIQEMPNQTDLRFAGIGSRETPPEVLQEMSGITEYLESQGFVLRSGGAKGADKAFERGSRHATRKEIYYAKDAEGDTIAQSLVKNLLGQTSLE